MTQIYSKTIKTPIGEMLACATEEGVCMLEFPFRKLFPSQKEGLLKSLNGEMIEGDHHFLQLLEEQIKSYFTGNLMELHLPLVLTGTDFQKKVWKALQQIPYGEKTTYLELSKKLGNAKAIRAVASANGANKISILIPCHRVVGTDGRLVGYGGGLRNKQLLLELEGSHRPSQTRLDF